MLEPAGGFRATDAPSLTGRSWEGYGRNFSSEAGLIPEQSLGAWGYCGRDNAGQRPGRLGAPGLSEELRALQGHAALVTVQLLLKEPLRSWSTNEPKPSRVCDICVPSADFTQWVATWVRALLD